MKVFGYFAICWLVFLSTGCGGSGSPYDYVPVSGKVTYEDGTPLPIGGFVIKVHRHDWVRQMWERMEVFLP
jgi:hypothetical protein